MSIPKCWNSEAQLFIWAHSLQFRLHSQWLFRFVSHRHIRLSPATLWDAFIFVFTEIPNILIFNFCFNVFGIISRQPTAARMNENGKTSSSRISGRTKRAQSNEKENATWQLAKLSPEVHPNQTRCLSCKMLILFCFNSVLFNKCCSPRTFPQLTARVRSMMLSRCIYPPSPCSMRWWLLSAAVAKLPWIQWNMRVASMGPLPTPHSHTDSDTQNDFYCV